jgi:hypothetical protein
MYVTEYHVIYSVRYYPRFHVTAVGLGTYYPCIRGYTCVGWTICGFSSGIVKRVLCSTRTPRPAPGPAQPHIHWDFLERQRVPELTMNRDMTQVPPICLHILDRDICTLIIGTSLVV